MDRLPLPPPSTKTHSHPCSLCPPAHLDKSARSTPRGGGPLILRRWVCPQAHLEEVARVVGGLGPHVCHQRLQPPNLVSRLLRCQRLGLPRLLSLPPRRLGRLGRRLGRRHSSRRLGRAALGVGRRLRLQAKDSALSKITQLPRFEMASESDAPPPLPPRCSSPLLCGWFCATETTLQV